MIFARGQSSLRTQLLRRDCNLTRWDYQTGGLAPDAAGLRSVRQGFPEQMVFRGRRQNRIVLTAIAAMKLGLRKPCADLRFTSGGKQGEPVEGAGER
jgi:hypothetical protein